MNPAPEKYENPMTHKETFFALAYLPIHISFLPSLLMLLYLKGFVTETEMNLLCYAIGLSMMLMYEMGYLRRQFDPLVDRLGYCIGQIFISYGIMLACNMLINTLLNFFVQVGSNPNNRSVMELAEPGSDGVLTAMAVFMAPVIEEIMFRGGLFGWLRQYSRFWAYFVTVAVFSLYHMWAYLMLDISNAVYLLQYIPVSILLCRLYEKTESIWSCIFFHMLNNFVAMRMLTLLGEII